MTKIKPIFISPPNSVGLDRIIAQLQQLINQSVYLDDSSTQQNFFDEGLLLPLALKDESTNIPIIYWKDKEYFPAEPNDNYRVISFFYQEDPGSFISFDGIQYQLNLIVWFNQDKYFRNKDYQIKEEFINEILNILRINLNFEDVDSIQVFRELESVFSNYSFIKEDKTRLKHPYQGFRIKFTISDNLDCGIITSPPVVTIPSTWDEFVTVYGRGYNYPSPTGQTTSYRTGDDAYIEANEFGAVNRQAQTLKARNTLADFLTLNNTNEFGNLNRFSDSVGNQNYDGTGGSLIDYVIDHYTGFGWHRIRQGGGALDTWNTGIDGALASTMNGFTDWFMHNINQLTSIYKAETGTIGLVNYPPFNISIYADFGASTTQEIDNSRYIRTGNTTELWANGAFSKITTTFVPYLLCRKHY